MKYFFALLLTCFSGMLFAQVNPVQLGRASNLIESNLFPLHGILPQQNMLAAVDSLDSSSSSTAMTSRSMVGAV
ncbi:MAG: hypothetical protein D6722_09140 [Bacteroidetes bacterium]|nr:MAG: hypothetical protein D6722_09140 [Bacteroidota bacterium]